MRKYLMIPALAGALVALNVAAQTTYDSLSSAIKNANMQGNAFLSQGVWQTKQDDSTITWFVKQKENLLNFEMFFMQGQGVMAVFNYLHPIHIRVESPNICSTLAIEKLVLLPNGVPDIARSIIHPRGELSCNDSKEDAILILMRQHAVQNPDTALKGNLFAGMKDSWACTEQGACKPGRFIKYVKFYGKQVKDKFYDPIAVELKPGASLMLNDASYVTFGEGSKAVIESLEYDLVKERGSAVIKEITANVRKGRLLMGDTDLQLDSGAKLSLLNLSIMANGDSFTTKGGTLAGAIGQGTLISLPAPNGKRSTLYVDTAAADLVNLELSGGANGMTGALTAGIMEVKLSKADLWLGGRSHFVLGPTQTILILGCPANEAPGCKALSWGPNGTYAIGRIAPLRAQIVQGTFPVTDTVLNIRNGRLEAENLLLDSRYAALPLTGQVDVLELEAATQNVVLGDKFTLTGADAKVTARALQFSRIDPLPSGEVLLTGTAKGVAGMSFGTMALNSASFRLPIKRDAGGRPSIEAGGLDASTTVYYSSGAVKKSGGLSLNVGNLRYQEGQGSGTLTLGVSGFADTLIIPVPPRGEDTVGGDLGKFKINFDVNPVVLDLALPGSGFLIRDIPVNWTPDGWKAGDARNTPLRIDVSIKPQTVVTAHVNTVVLIGGGTNTCNPQAKLIGQARQLNATVDFIGSENKVVIHDAAWNEPIAASYEDRGCRNALSLLCGLLGAGTGVFTGGLTGAVVAGLCIDRVDGLTDQAQAEVTRQANQEIQSYTFTLH